MKRYLILFPLLAIIGNAIPQSNYGIQGNDIDYRERDGLPQTATLAGKVTELDTLAPQIKLNRTQANLNCADGSMKVNLGFKEPFYGIAYADFNRNSACYAQGTGNLLITLELPLKGCGTRQDPQRVFTNNVIVRFHPGLEMEGDEIITIVCRYPPPIIEAPPAPIIQTPILPAGIIPKPLKEFEVLLIICAILFLGLMLLGLGCSYYCLKHRNIQVYRKPSPFEDDDSEKVSTIESFANLKIPRVQPPSIESSSEVPIEETLASDYPSSIEEGPRRPDTVSSEYSDTHIQVDRERVGLTATRAHKPQFDVNLRVSKQPEATKIRFSETDSSISSLEGSSHATSTFTADLHIPPKKRASPTILTKVQTPREPKRVIQETEYFDTLTVVDREDALKETRYTKSAKVPPPVPKKPDVSVHTVDDVYLQTIIERRMIEDEEIRRREVTQFYKKDQPSKWDVSIKSHGIPEEEVWERGSETTDVASSIGWSAIEETPIRPRYTTVDHDHVTRRMEVNREELDRSTTVSRAMQKLKEDDASVWNKKWNVLFRVLETPPRQVSDNDDDYDSEIASVLTEDDKEKWRQIITTESTLRSLLTEATVKEDYERIRKDVRYEKLFQPEKWDVIIRVLAPPPTEDEPKYYSDSTSEVSSSTISGGSSNPLRVYHRNEGYRKKSTDTTGESRKSITNRSMTEMEVDFAAGDRFYDDDGSSVLSSGPGGTARSVADRSQTEIIEFAPLDEEDDDELESSSNTITRQNRSKFSSEDHHNSSHQVDHSGRVIQAASSMTAQSSFSSSRLTRF